MSEVTYHQWRRAIRDTMRSAADVEVAFERMYYYLDAAEETQVHLPYLEEQREAELVKRATDQRLQNLKGASK